MQAQTLPVPLVRRYLRALGKMTRDIDPDNRKFAHEALNDLGMPGVNMSEYLWPVHNLPLRAMPSPQERRLRLLVESCETLVEVVASAPLPEICHETA